MANITLKLNSTQVEGLIAHYQPWMVASTGDYVTFSALKDGVKVVVYQNSKHPYIKVTFTGAYPLKEARQFDPFATITKPKVKTTTGYLDIGEQCGSDEVGFGDLFGPLVVAAAYLKADQFDELTTLGITDSKKMDDDYVLKIGPLVLKHFIGVYFIVDNPKYNELIGRGYNMNKIKAMLHNQALRSIRKKVPGDYPAYIDQFCAPDKFVSYLSVACVDNVIFRTKAESLYPAVALASVIARYVFLIKIGELNRQYDTTFPLGASLTVDEFARGFLARHGKDALLAITKNNFKNFARILPTDEA